MSNLPLTDDGMWSQTLKVQISDKTAAVRASANFRLPPSHSSFPFLSPPFVISFFHPFPFFFSVSSPEGVGRVGHGGIAWTRRCLQFLHCGVVVVIRFSQLFEGKKLSKVFEDRGKLHKLIISLYTRCLYTQSGIKMFSVDDGK